MIKFDKLLTTTPMNSTQKSINHHHMFIGGWGYPLKGKKHFLISRITHKLHYYFTGAQVSGISLYYISQTTTLNSTSTVQSSSIFNESVGTDILLYVGIGSALVVVTILVVLVALCIRYNKRYV